MWKIHFNFSKTDFELQPKQIIALVEKHDGCFLFSNIKNSNKSTKSFLGLNPVIKIYDDNYIINNKQHKYNSLDLIDQIIETNSSNVDFPLLMGYMAYDYKNNLEESGLFKNLANKEMPLLFFAVYEYYYILDEQYNVIKTVKLDFSFKFNKIKVSYKFPENNSEFQIKETKYLGTNINKEQYQKSVKKIINYIKSGDIYQVNLTREIRGETQYNFREVAYNLFCSNAIEFGVISKVFYTYLISTSPERFFKIENKNIVTSPIKGTAKKAGNIDDNKIILKKLLENKKERAELAMIVDLLRNDISRICEPSSVVVDKFPEVKELENVFHLYCNILGNLKNILFSDIVKNLFPGGSISGCPKIRACQIIEEMEQIGRGAYTGSYGYITTKGNMDFNILIRTLFMQNQSIRFHVGGGITIKSDPLLEYEETIYKAKNIWEALNMEYIHEERYCI